MSSFIAGSTTATFHSTIRGSRQQAGDVQRLTLGIVLDFEAEWYFLQELLTTKYHVHSPIGGPVVVDVVNGAGEGLLDVDGLGACSAIMVALDRPTWLPNERSMGSAEFIITAGSI